MAAVLSTAAPSHPKWGSNKTLFLISEPTCWRWFQPQRHSKRVRMWGGGSSPRDVVSLTLGVLVPDDVITCERLLTHRHGCKQEHCVMIKPAPISY